nr:unnamed protein product [Callosobruchus chinensis]
MQPFPRRQSRMDERKEKFNKRLCRARRVVENEFGILTHRWCLLFRPIEVKIDTAVLVIKAICVLHNYLREKKFDQLSTVSEARRPTNSAFQIRDKFVSFFNNDHA